MKGLILYDGILSHVILNNWECYVYNSKGNSAICIIIRIYMILLKKKSPHNKYVEGSTCMRYKKIKIINKQINNDHISSSLSI